jgi:hypothetical protein
MEIRSDPMEERCVDWIVCTDASKQEGKGQDKGGEKSFLC